MAGGADRTLNQPRAIALGDRTLTVDLRHLERHVHVAQGVDGDHRDAEVAIGLGHPAQPVGTQAVEVGCRRHLGNRCVEGGFFGRQREVVVELVDESVGVDAGAVVDAVDRAVTTEGAPHRALQRVRKADVEDRALAAGEVLHHFAQLVALRRGHTRDDATRADGREGRPDAGAHECGDVGEVGRGVTRHASQRLRGQLVATKVVEQFAVAGHAAHRHRAAVTNLVSCRGVGLVFNRRRGHVPTHRVADDEGLGRCSQGARVGAGNAVDLQRERVGVFHTGAHVVVVLAVAGRGPGIAVVHQVAADRRVGDHQARTGADVTVGVHHQLAVPVERHLDVEGRAVEHTRRRLEAFGLSSRLAVGDAEHLDFPDERFDIVYSWGVLHHSP
ncbi:MAG: class I SAM-dependent methyltransferase, partial [Cytophagales bacterium]|nr:class I SAM-dependent methyltransferase [Rhizobacter sp.]